jgi:putative membrane-bound dehydrogenase-like protein
MREGASAEGAAGGRPAACSALAGAVLPVVLALAAVLALAGAALAAPALPAGPAPAARAGEEPAAAGGPLLDAPLDAPLPPPEALARMKVPEGFRVTVFAAEPDVRQPIAFTIDSRGRLWVAECYAYPHWVRDDTSGRDRIVILADEDGDGRADRRVVFADKEKNLSGIELGFGGVWACATPRLLFFPDQNRDDRPDGPPRVVLDGWDLEAKHNVFNGLTWGPDGWLYGLNGILSNSRVGRPGAAEAERVPINCGVWRYHPVRETFEVVAWGTTNPWGLDFDDHGEMFISNCVIPHLFHVVPGAHFQRMFGNDFDPHLYGLLESSADHLHWAGGEWQSSRGGKGKHGEAGGGHAHVGAMVYLGDNWPDDYRDSIYVANVHGNRVNRDSLERRGAGYVARHRPDFLLANDEWFRALELQYGPDGAVYLSDWSDTGECHDTDAHGAHHESGRIYRIAFGEPKPVKVDVASYADTKLVELQLAKNDWYVREARRTLAERAAGGKDLKEAHERLVDLFSGTEDVTRKLRALWALRVSGGLSEAVLSLQLDHESEHIRAWAVRFLCEDGAVEPVVVERLAALAREDPSPFVRLYLASSLQRLPPGRRWGIAAGLVAEERDAEDPTLPLMIWYGIEPAVAADPARGAALAAACKIPLIRRHIARRLAEGAAGKTEADSPPPAGGRGEPGEESRSRGAR